MKPVLAVTPGEPAGIGPEILLKFHRDRPEFPVVAVADPSLLQATARSLGMDCPVQTWQAGDAIPRNALACYPVELRAAVRAGQLDPANAGYVLDTLRQAVSLVTSGAAQALVTGPVHKGVINEGGHAFTGHTEFLAQLSGGGPVVMMLAAPGLRVALVTTHLPLKDVPAALTKDRLETVLRITQSELQNRFGIADPRLQVLGLNPHAGEGGHLGHEEADVISPVIESLRFEGMALEGPVPADTAFNPSRLSHCDAVIAMYHDQGLPVLKHMGFGQSVNITLGLPFIRTSVDHGTALDLAGKGVADSGSLYQAMSVAQELSVQSEGFGGQ
jgi:4-hydroxythreonine-4-phosphate dehydrogenase